MSDGYLVLSLMPMLQGLMGTIAQNQHNPASLRSVADSQLNALNTLLQMILRPVTTPAPMPVTAPAPVTVPATAVPATTPVTAPTPVPETAAIPLASSSSRTTTGTAADTRKRKDGPGSDEE